MAVAGTYCGERLRAMLAERRWVNLAQHREPEPLMKLAFYGWIGALLGVVTMIFMDIVLSTIASMELLDMLNWHRLRTASGDQMQVFHPRHWNYICGATWALLTDIRFFGHLLFLQQFD